ncbi:pyridoxamine 5'-phosphate oxidase family protein [Nonomuraea sp. SBT364]|uniref:pyridoxamine 5'-phosphate oxidase family protein n=1 Tax=Nonomuraea sp. SBT364 TaxID=1580530 RepID=UPI00066E475E|nr:pyridoxamine 5'-phosphate oxidase family protein [Nonomuraea sp. SBT364]
MTSWKDVEAEAPGLAATVRRLLEGQRHKVLATLRADGSPRVSGTESQFRDGELWMGSMAGAVKALDLRRDPRMALHVTTPAEPPGGGAWEGDAKLAGRAVEVTDEATLAAFELPGTDSHLFRIEVAEVVLTRVEGDELVIDMWHRGKGVRQVRRK